MAEEEEWWHRRDRNALEQRRQDETADDARLWAQFMAGSLACPVVTMVEDAAKSADIALAEYRKRFPRTTEPK